MRCRNCGREIDNPWGICPYCGAISGELEDNFMNFARLFGGKAVIRQDGDSFIVILELQGSRHAFRITPIDVGEAAPLSPLPPPPSPAAVQTGRIVEKTEEPPAEITYTQDRIYIKINLPEVGEEELEIDELEDSVEVRVYKEKTRYFKLIPIPEGYHVISKEVLPSEVIVTLGRK